MHHHIQKPIFDGFERLHLVVLIVDRLVTLFGHVGKFVANVLIAPAVNQLTFLSASLMVCNLCQSIRTVNNYLHQYMQI